MAMSERRTVVAVFDSRDHAEMAVRDLCSAGFTDDEVGIALRETGSTDVAGGAQGGGAGEGAATGAVGGATVGGILGALAAGLIPGIGPVIAGGILAGVLGGAAVGAVGGGILGALVAEGVPEEEARYYDREFQSGRTVVTVRASGRFDAARSVLRSHGGRFADSEMGTTTTTTATSDAERDITGRREFEPGSGSMSTGMGKGGYGRSGDELGRMEAGYRPWGEVREDYQGHWTNRIGATGRDWVAGEPGYHYGYEMSHDPRYSSRSWEDAEPELRRSYSDWYRQRDYRGEASAWDEIKDDIHAAWDNARRGMRI